MIRKILSVLGIAVIHFSLLLALTRLGIWLAEFGANTFSIKTVVWLSRVMYFPIVTLALFPREIFPGGLIYVPIFLNSLIWAVFLYAAAVLIGAFRRRGGRS